MKTKIISIFQLNKFKFGNQEVTQFVLFECKYLFSIIFFYFHKSDGEQDRYHTHAFNAISFKLFGEYTEYILVENVSKYSERRTQFFKYFPKNRIHKIGNSNGCLTMLLSGRWEKEWKEYNDNGVVTSYSWGRKKESHD